VEASFTMTIAGGKASIDDGSTAQPDLIVRGTSEDLANIFWGDENPASSYMQGAIAVQGSPDNVMRLDAMALLIYLEGQKDICRASCQGDREGAPLQYTRDGPI
jgi:putative sterol carrier protein